MHTIIVLIYLRCQSACQNYVSCNFGKNKGMHSVRIVYMELTVKRIVHFIYCVLYSLSVRTVDAHSYV